MTNERFQLPCSFCHQSFYYETVTYLKAERLYVCAECKPGFDATMALPKKQRKVGRPDPFYLPHDISKPDAVIFDVDGTLMLLGDRDPYNAAKAHLDPPHLPIVRLAQHFDEMDRYHLLVVSGREEAHRDVTETSLRTAGVYPHAIHMRQPFDVDAKGKKLNDAVVKARIFREHIQPRYNVRWVLDDRNRVVDVWRALGVCTLQVQPGDF